MAKMIKKIVTAEMSDVDNYVTESAIVTQTSYTQTLEYLVYFLFSLLDVLLSFRFLLKLLGASTASGFVASIYAFTGFFILPFEGMFRRSVTQGIETTAVFEPATVVAIVVYLLLAWGIVTLIQIVSGNTTD